MRIEELEVVCQEAARNLVERSDRPIPATVVLPLPSATRVTSLPDWPDDDDERAALLERFAADVMAPANAPCFGFIAEAVAQAQGQPVDVVVVAYSARRNHPRITAAVLADDALGDFAPPEGLAPGAFPFLVPLQHAVDQAAPPDALSG